MSDIDTDFGTEQCAFWHSYTGPHVGTNRPANMPAECETDIFTECTAIVYAIKSTKFCSYFRTNESHFSTNWTALCIANNTTNGSTKLATLWYTFCAAEWSTI